MHGCGNDYVYVDLMQESVDDKSLAALKLSDRHFGIGGDGVIYIQKGKNADFEMVMYNADGSRGAMCGNGIRCVAKYCYDNGLTDKTSFTIESMGAVKYIDVNVENGEVVSAKSIWALRRLIKTMFPSMSIRQRQSVKNHRCRQEF
ncbi:MAG: diaminopimelate epimerase [Eubacterium sp.]